MKYSDMEVGTVIEGTYTAPSLIRAFADELERIDTANKYSILVNDATTFLNPLEANSVSDVALEQALLVYELMDALNCYAPKGITFGANGGEGNNYGWWTTDND